MGCTFQLLQGSSSSPAVGRSARHRACPPTPSVPGIKPRSRHAAAREHVQPSAPRWERPGWSLVFIAVKTTACAKLACYLSRSPTVSGAAVGQGLHLPGRLEQALLTGPAVGGRRPALSQPGPRRRATRWPGERSATPKAPYASVRVTPSDFHSPCAYRVWLAALQLPCALPCPQTS